jgi:DNA-binding response OmpR family regulator
MNSVSNRLILVIDSNETIRADITAALKNASFLVITASTAAKGLAEVLRKNPSLIVVSKDMWLTKQERVCDRLFQVSDVPLIVLGTKESEAAVLLLAGADACMTRHVSLAELVARARSLLRRSKMRGCSNENSVSKA